MKSIFLTFIMFIALFGLLRPSVVSHLEGGWFPVVSFIIFVIVIGVAIYMFGLPTKQNFRDAFKLKTKKKEEEDNNEKNK